MKLSCTRDNLHRALSITSHLTSKNINLPVLQNVLLKAEGGGIRFTSTNLELAVSCSVRGKMEEAGEFTIPSKLFFDYVSLLPNETVNLSLVEEAVDVACGSNKTKIKGISSSEFPLVPTVQGQKTYKIPVEELRGALSRVLFAVATNESRPELTGVCAQFSGGKLTLASTDSYRLAETTISYSGGGDGDHSVILPAKTLQEVGRILSIFKDEVEAASEVELTLSDNQAMFTYGSVELISRIVEGNYPDYRQIIPTAFQTEAVIDKEDFVKAVKTASLFSRTGLFDVTLELHPEKGTLSIHATDVTRGENTAECAAKITGEKNHVTVNFRYLLDGLNAMNTNSVHFRMIDTSNPCLIEPEGSAVRYRYIVMPIKQ